MAGLLIAGCGGQGPSTPADLAGVDKPPESAPVANDALLGLYEVSVDPAGFATLEPLQRDSQADSPQARSYDLDLDRFLSFQSLGLHGTGLTDEGDLVLEFIHRHPMPRPNVDAPITATNRADLGYTGRLVILANTSRREFFNGEISLDPSLVKDPDGYLHTGDLVHQGAQPNNTFPYVMLVDESRDNRVGNSNNGSMQGSYDAGNGGWQRSNLGDGRGWTGYDFIHAGQEAISSITLDQSRLEGKPLKFVVALMAKYTDPRGATNRESRMPAAPADVAQFAYRLPHAALDLSVANSCGGLVIGEKSIDPIDLSINVRDWDAYAAESTSDDLSLEPDVAKVRPGAAGVPTASLDCPVLSASPFPLTVSGGTGIPGDELSFSGTLTNVVAPRPGNYFGLVRLIDPEDGLPATGSRFGVDPSSLVPDSARALAIRTYLPIPIRVHQGAGWAQLWGGKDADNVFAIALDPQGDIYVAGSYGVAGADFDPTSCDDVYASNGFEDAYLLKLDRSGRREWVATWGGPHVDQATALAIGPTGEILVGGVTGGSIDMDPGTGVTTSTGMNNSAFLSRLDSDGNYLGHVRWGGPELTKPVDIAIGNDRIGVLGEFRGLVDMDPGAGNTTRIAAASDLFLSNFNAQLELQWVNTWGGPLADYARGVAASVDGDFVAGGSFQDTVNFNPPDGSASLTSNGQTDAFICKYNAAGTFQWVRGWGGNQADQVTKVVIGESGQVTVVGQFSQIVDLDPGIGNTTYQSEGFTDAYASRFDPYGGFVWATAWGGADPDNASSLARQSDGGIAVAGTYRGNVVFTTGSEGSLTSVGPESDPYLLRLSPAGDPTWVSGWGSPQADGIAGLASAIDGALLIAGTTSGALDIDPGIGTEIRIAHYGSDPYILRLTADGQL